jgi:hypothetical protein
MNILNTIVNDPIIFRQSQITSYHKKNTHNINQFILSFISKTEEWKPISFSDMYIYLYNF